ncbi:hypothetical protein CGMCC3_g13911 [Colletotrichum fructicola]|uniref:Uncharacterized protein n=1 Tax=Colletotrichum fructicola (strain Nara gc5) TaxID=1213859 RepID=L2FAE2_COLFN|nr:uncharacterized protein CGMCC3_g13911 [Colletotrichum fructicola]KAE9569972.1 hypothetical protein CGMCC3_g13911 [Colletotrichum fructicola]KAF4479720.1 hypothetical protein CGGC5_v011655 [Colletotrichum fructicola Nara gc5]
MENSRPPIGGLTAGTTPFQEGDLVEESIGHRNSCQNSCDGCSQDSQQSVTVCGDDCHHHGDNAVCVPVDDRNVNTIYPSSCDCSAHSGYGLAASAQGTASQDPASAQLPILDYQPTRSYFTIDMAASRGYFDPIRSASRAPSFVSSYPPTYMPSYEPTYSFPPVPPQSPLPPRPPVTPDAPTSSVSLSYANNELPSRVDSDNRTCIHHDCFRRWLDENEDSPSNKNVESYLGDELSYVYSSEESSSCSGKEEEAWNSSDELDWEGFQDFSAPLSNEYTIETTTGNGYTTNETFEDNENQEESQRLTDSTNGRINTSNVSRECTPSQEDGHGDVVFLYAIENCDIDHVGRQGNTNGQTTTRPSGACKRKLEAEESVEEHEDSDSNNESLWATKRACIAQTPQEEADGDEGRLLEPSLQDPVKFLAGTIDHSGNGSVRNDDMPIINRSDQQNSEQLDYQLELIFKLSQMGPAIASSDAPIYDSIYAAIWGMAVAALQAAASEGLLDRLEWWRSQAKEKVEGSGPARANGEDGGLEVPVAKPTGEDLEDIYSSSG